MRAFLFVTWAQTKVSTFYNKTGFIPESDIEKSPRELMLMSICKLARFIANGVYRFFTPYIGGFLKYIIFVRYSPALC